MNKLVRLGFPALTISDYECDKLSAKVENLEALLNFGTEMYLLKSEQVSNLTNVSTLKPNLSINVLNRLQCDEEGIYEENHQSPRKVIEEASR